MENTLKLDTAELRKCLTACNKVAEARSTIPILSHVLIDVTPDGARFTVTDLEVSRSQLIESPNTLEPWKACVPVKALLKLLPSKVKDIKQAPVVEMYPNPQDEGRSLVILAAGGNSTLRCLPAEEFPTIPTPEASSDVCFPTVISGEVWTGLHAKVFPAISTEESRFQLSGTLFEFNGSARAIATDGHRLHRADAELRVSGAEQSILIPRQMLAVIARDPAFGKLKARRRVGVLKSGKNKGEPKYRTIAYRNDLHIYSSEFHVWIETHSVRYGSRILEGTFPDHDRVIKKGDAPCVVTTRTEDVLAAIGAVEHCTGDRARTIRVDFSGDSAERWQDRLPVFSAADPDKGEAHSALNRSTSMAGRLAKDKPRKPSKVKGRDAHYINKTRTHAFEKDMGAWLARDPSEDSQQFGINPDYLSDVCKAIGEGEIYLDVWNENTQFQVRSAADPSACYVIMPIRI